MKKIKKLSALILGGLLALGVGAGLGSSKEAVPVHAAENDTHSITGFTGEGVSTLLNNKTTPSAISVSDPGYSIKQVIIGWKHNKSNAGITASVTVGGDSLGSGKVGGSNTTSTTTIGDETYTVSFNGNGGTGSMSAVTDVSGSYTLPANGFTAPSGKAFSGWKAGNTGDLIAAGASYTVSADVTFFAQWADAYTVTYTAGTNGSGSYAHTLQPAGTYTLLDFTSLTGVSANSGYRFKDYTVGGVSKDAGDTITLSAATSVTVNFEEQPLETTYDFTTNFSTYASLWSNSYGVHEGLNGKTDIGGDYAATIDLYYVSKQSSTINDRPVFASKTASGSFTQVLKFTLGETGYKIKEVLVTFAQWTTKTPSVALYKGGTVSGTALDTATIGTKNTLSVSSLNDTVFSIGYSDGSTSSNVQSGLTSIYISLEAQVVMTETLSVTGTLTNGNQYSGSYLDVSGLTFTANYDDGGTQVLNVNQLNQPFPKLVYGTNSYQVSYTEAGITATGTVSLTVLQDTLNSLSWTGKKTTYNEGETLDQGTILAKYGSGNEVPLTLEDVAIYIYTGTWNPTTATIITALTILNNLDHDGVYVKLGYEGVYSIAASITVNFIPTTMYTEGGDGTCDTATLIKDIANLNVGDKVLIAASGTHNFVMSTTQNENNRGSVAATKSGDKITDVDETTMQVVTIVAGTETDSFGFYVGDAGYLYAAGASSKNLLRTKTTLDANGSFIITIASDGVATATSQMTGTKSKLKFNSTNNPPIFSCYDSGQADIAFYSLDSAGSSGLNYEYLLDVLAGDWCDMDLEGLNKIHARYTDMTESEIAHFNVEVIVGDDTNSYTGLVAYTEAMVRRTLLTPNPSSGNLKEDTAINEKTSIAFIVIVAILGVTAIGAFFIVRRKETN